MTSSYIEVELNHQPVELCKLLKIANLVGGGGEAKIVISEGYVLLNGEVEYQKRKKIYHEDVVEFNGEVVQLMINDVLDTTVTDEPTSQSSSILQEPSPQEKSTQPKSPKPQKRPKNSKNNKDSKTNKDKTFSKAANQENSEVIIPSGPQKRRPISF